MSENNTRRGAPGGKTIQSLCWDCAKATGGCSWSNYLKPVEGWNAVPTKRATYYGTYQSNIVLDCPEFERDAYGHGMKRYKGVENVTA